MINSRINLNETFNNSCKRCPAEDRESLPGNNLCPDIFSVVDDKPLRCVGGWGRKKIYFLIQYFNIFTQGMKNQWGGNIAYFEIASGPGRCIDRENGFEFDGSAIAILKSPGATHLKAARFIDIDSRVVDTLNARIDSLPNKGNFRALMGSFENGETLATLIKDLNPVGLNLVFIDPTDCSVPFSTIQTLHDRGIKFDLIINVATKTDFNRNMESALNKPDSPGRMKYESFLGGSELFIDPRFVQAVRTDHFDDGRRLFAQAYQRSLSRLGFKHFESEEVNGFYEVLFATTHPRGLDFWRKAQAIKMDGQRGLW